MCNCEEFEDYEFMMETNLQASENVAQVADSETSEPVQEPEPIPQVIALKRKK